MHNSILARAHTPSYPAIPSPLPPLPPLPPLSPLPPLIVSPKNPSFLLLYQHQHQHQAPPTGLSHHIPSHHSSHPSHHSASLPRPLLTLSYPTAPPPHPHVQPPQRNSPRLIALAQFQGITVLVAYRADPSLVLVMANIRVYCTCTGVEVSPEAEIATVYHTRRY